MQVSNLKIKNFRGIKEADLLLPAKCVLIGDNNTGKSTILESLDLVLGPDRLHRNPVIEEHDFYRGEYHGENARIIDIEVTITDLSDEQKRRFGNYIEWWNSESLELHTESPVKTIDGEEFEEALRISFIGKYDPDDDSFVGDTVYTRTITEKETPDRFHKTDKQYCGFLYLRSLRTGTRALSLEAGSLLDIILRMKEVRPQMWESTIRQLNEIHVAAEPDLGVVQVLKSIQEEIQNLAPREWGVAPHLKVSSLTRDQLRKVITAFVATGDGEHAAPFYRQGTGTINLLVLAMLSIIAKEKSNVIFAMEEPETAISPYAQKRVVTEVCRLSAQAIFTTHSPFVMEEFQQDETVVLHRDHDGLLEQREIVLPASMKLKRYRTEFRTKHCEALLARRVLIAEGQTEATSLPVVARRLSEFDSTVYSSLEALGICTIDAGSQNNLYGLACFYKGLGKTVFILCDKQDDELTEKLKDCCDILFMHEEAGFEKLVLENTTEKAMKRYLGKLDWPEHLEAKYPDPLTEPYKALLAYFRKYKGEAVAADFLAMCKQNEIPEWLSAICKRLSEEYAYGKENVVEENNPEE